MPCSRSLKMPRTAYVNRAHNDILEVWLETGVLGLALIGLFVIWLVRRSVEIWRSAPASGASQLDWSLVRAATIVPVLIVAHSLVDFPLRTGAMMAVMAFACALLIEPPVGAASRRTGRELAVVPERARHRTQAPEPVTSPALPLYTHERKPSRSVAFRRIDAGELMWSGRRSGPSQQSRAHLAAKINHQTLPRH